MNIHISEAHWELEHKRLERFYRLHCAGDVIDSMPRIPDPARTIPRSVSVIWELKHWALQARQHGMLPGLFIFGRRGAFAATLAAHLELWDRVIIIHPGKSEIDPAVMHLDHYQSFDEFWDNRQDLPYSCHVQVFQTNGIQAPPWNSYTLQPEQMALSFPADEMWKYDVDPGMRPFYMNEYMPLWKIRYYRPLIWTEGACYILSEVKK